MNLKQYFSLHYQKVIGCILLSLCIAGTLFSFLPLANSEIEKAKVSLIQKSYYQININGKPTLFFSDFKDSTFFHGTYKQDSIAMHKAFLTGYWANRIPFLPSSYGKIVAPWHHRPNKIVNERNQRKLHRLLFHLFIQVDNELGGLQTQNNELSYYLRKHSVQDFGYNKIAEYHERILQKMDSLEQLQKVISSIKPNDKIRIYQINTYRTAAQDTYNTAAQSPKDTLKESEEATFCKRTSTDYQSKTIQLRTQSGLTPLSVFSRLGVKEAIKTINTNKPYGGLSATLATESADYRDATGYYRGEIKNGLPHGYGEFFGKDGAYYNGHFEKGKRDGFGFQVAPHQYLMVGEWKNGVCNGERLTYTESRIYGIDLSKHNHERNKKVYPIHWDRLRITHLGTLSNKTIKGKVNYPVSFIYIKSTEGCTVLNKYYAADYKAARAQGYRVGTYHFFSTTSPGADQADYFLNNSYYKSGDMPVVLDVEPSDAQIEKMGGAEALFKQVRAWMNRLYAKTHKRPVLYISQMFANNYMPLAPDLGDNYLVWIARYGEYKPNIKLAYWQLSPDGRVRGIEGDVDINVFNGYENQWTEFTKKHCK